MEFRVKLYRPEPAFRDVAMIRIAPIKKQFVMKFRRCMLAPYCLEGSLTRRCSEKAEDKILTEGSETQPGNCKFIVACGLSAELHCCPHGRFFDHALHQAHTLCGEDGIRLPRLDMFASAHRKQFGAHCVEGRVGASQNH